MTQQHRIGIDLPNIAVGPKNQHKCMVRHSLHHVPREHDAALTKLGNTIFAHHVTCVVPMMIAQFRSLHNGSF